MSLLFDSLRRGRQTTRPQGGTRRTAQADAVLATLGYAPDRRGGGARRMLGRAAGTAVLFAAGWFGWQWYSGADARPVPTSGARIGTARGPQSKPLPPPRKPSSEPGVTAPAGTSPGTPSAPVPAAPSSVLNRQSPVVSPQSPVVRPQSPVVSPQSPVASPQSPVAVAPQSRVELPPSAPPRQTRADPVPVAPPRLTPVGGTSTARSTPTLPRAPAPSAAVTPSPGPSAGLKPDVAPTAAGGVPAAAAADDFQLALYYQRAGDFDNALIQYRTLLQRSPMNAQARNNLGLLYQTKGMLDEAVAEFQRALYIDARYLRARNNLGVALLNQGKVDAAAAEFRSVLAQEPRNVDALVNLALAEKAAGRPERAKETLLRALVIDQRSAPAHYNLGVLFEMTGEAARAVEHYRAFLDHAGTGYSDRAPEVRARLDALTTPRHP